MKLPLIVLAALAAAVLLALAIHADTGYVLLSYRDISAEMAFSTLVMLVLVGWLALSLVMWLLWRIWTLPARTAQLYRHRRVRRARRSLNRGLIELAEGHWSDGERHLVRHAKDCESPLINYLIAARAAQLQRADDRRDDYLRLAYEAMPAATVAVLLTQAELQIAHRQFEHALATLRRLQEIKPRHAFALKLLARLYGELGDWGQLEELLPSLRQQQALSPDELDRLEARVATEHLRKFVGDRENERPDTYWSSLPRRLRQQAALVEEYALALHRSGVDDEAESVIRDALKREWNDTLVLAYGGLRAKDLSRQLARVETWLKERGDSASLLLTAGRLCIANQLWGKARSYIESSLAARPTAEAYEELGRLLQELGQPEAAMQAFSRGLTTALGHTHTTPPGKGARPALQKSP